MFHVSGSDLLSILKKFNKIMTNYHITIFIDISQDTRISFSFGFPLLSIVFHYFSKLFPTSTKCRSDVNMK
jgi:hypothetical protein